MAAPGRGIRWHDDFGYSDPPAFLWAAYFRHVRDRRELGDHCRSADDFIDVLVHRPFDDARPEDAAMVLGFLRYHAVTLRQGNRHIEVVPLQGRVLSGRDPSMLNGIRSLVL